MNGDMGKFRERFKIYGKEIDPLGNKIISEKDSSDRTIHWVKEVQKLK